MRDIDFKNIRQMDGSLLLIFHELLRERRATKVAARLGLSQSAISHALSRLRAIYGDPLFVRKPHGLEPTRRALELGPRVDTLLGLADETLQRERRFDPRQSTRRFILSAPEFVAALIGARLVQAFRKQAPHASFVTQYIQPQTAFQALKRGEIDLALGRFGAVPAGLGSEVLFEDRYCVVARRGHREIRSPLSPGRYAKIGHVFAMAEGNEEDTGSSDVTWHAGVPRWLTVLTIVAASDAIGTVPLKFAERHAKLLNLQILRPPFLQDRITVSAVRRTGAKDAGADWFAEQVKAAVK